MQTQTSISAVPGPVRSAQSSAQTDKGIGVTVHGLHHFANYCKDAEETRQFYEEIIGLRLVHVVRADVLPGSGMYLPYIHLFFQLDDGSSLAFFDFLEDPEIPAVNVGAHPWTDHLALRVSSVEALQQAKQRLEAAGYTVKGPIDHEFVLSIYFVDPNGLNLELTTALPEGDAAYHEHEAQVAHARVAAWIEEKRQAREKAAARNIVQNQ